MQETINAVWVFFVKHKRGEPYWIYFDNLKIAKQIFGVQKKWYTLNMKLYILQLRNICSEYYLYKFLE